MQRIPMVAIDKIQRELQDAPECPVEEVSKVRAVRLLAPQICAMQSKGYSLVAIAAMLSERGLAVTAPALKSYLNVAKEDTGVGSKKLQRRSRGSTPKPLSEGNRAAASIGTPVVKAANVTESATTITPSRPPTAPPPTAPTSASGTGPEKAVAPRVAESAPRRSAFVPSKDSEDI